MFGRREAYDEGNEERVIDSALVVSNGHRENIEGILHNCEDSEK